MGTSILKSYKKYPELYKPRLKNCTYFYMDFADEY